MTKMIKLFLSFTFILGLSYAQSLEGNWDLNAAIVEYTYEVREFDSAEDSLNASYSVTASWPSSAAAAAGFGYTHTLLSYGIGDTITVALVPLVNEDLLAANGVAMNVDLFDDGNFSINAGSTYPTTETINCSTFATVPGVDELGTWTSTPGFDHPDDPTVHTMGWGISLSDVFAQFNAADIAGGEYGVDYGVGTDMENWGMVTIGYDDEAHTTPQDLEIFWEAHDGDASGLGVDTTGALNGVTGVPTSPADTVSIYNMEMYLAYVHEDTNLWYNLGWTGSEDDEWYSMPALGGGGHPIDPTNDSTFTINPITGDTLPVGTVSANHGYLFDPTGGDGIPFNGDEALAPTGYFFTFNFLEANQVFSGVFEAVLAATGDLQASLTAASDSVAFIYLDSESSAAIGAGVGTALYDQYVACVGAGGDADECSAVFQQGPTATLLQVQSACQYQCGVDDSGWDFDEEDETGRLVFEVDNRCIPDNTTQRVNTFWTYAGETITELEVDEDAPVAQKFTLHGNYPNPFNPVTKIRFATEKTSDVKVTIYSILGEEVSVAHNGQLSSGTYDISWHGKDSRGNKVPSGVYFYEVRSDERSHKGKMLLLK
tara:strand:- start:987 stop:2786 length:1800 start_codon:yes stop_codon:yes gene_type:complete